MGTFIRQLDLTKGLYVEAYGDHVKEQIQAPVHGGQSNQELLGTFTSHVATHCSFLYTSCTVISTLELLKLP